MKRISMMRIQTILTIALTCILGSHSAFAQTAEANWVNLVGETFKKNPAFAYVQNDPALPNVLIYGDSISMGYTLRVRESLKGKANVYRIYCNGGDTARVIPAMKKMHDAMAEHWSFKWDVIHFNAGLHDLKHKNYNRAYPQIRLPEAYAENCKKIFAYFKEIAPDAKVIFATTTPVPKGSKGRDEGEEVKYNQAALQVLKDYPQIMVNDLCAFTKQNDDKFRQGPGNVHYNKTGANAQGDEVTKVILKALSNSKNSKESNAVGDKK